MIRCSMRVVDSFGTEPEYNFPSYAKRKKMKSAWGKLNFFPKQFNTMFREFFVSLRLYDLYLKHSFKIEIKFIAVSI